jgi:hypothetical protein
VTLPAASTAGQHLIFINVAGPTNGSASATLTAAGTNTIQDGPETTNTGTDSFLDLLELVSDGAGKWWVIVRQ